MPGPILHLGAQLMCAHAGQATPTSTSPSVQVLKKPITTLSNQYVVAGCTFPAMSVGGPPCVKGQFAAATKVFSNGQPVLIYDASALAMPNSVPVAAMGLQKLVVAT
jgi:hypothetical protein